MCAPSEHDSPKKIGLVIVNGFLTPSSWRSYPKSIPDNVEIIPINPCSTGSLHDRCCQIFYQIMGGRVDYGEEHSQFHGHSRYGEYYSKGEYPQWSEEHPLIFVGHSFGGLTSWTLQNYLEQQRFPGYKTSSKWISGVITVNTPFNGTLQTYSRGIHYKAPPIAEWASQGHFVGILSQVIEFLNIPYLRNFIDGHQHWQLSWQYQPLLSLYCLLLCLCGYGIIHSNTDNVGYDLTIHSQKHWNQLLQSFDSSYYFAIVGDLTMKRTTNEYLGVKKKDSIFHRILKRITTCLLMREDDSLFQKEGEQQFIAGIDVSKWLALGHDGLISVYSQEFPRLSGEHNSMKIDSILSPQKPKQQQQQQPLLQSTSLIVKGVEWYFSKYLPGKWHYYHLYLSHISANFECRNTWETVYQMADIIYNNNLSQRNREKQEEAGLSCDDEKKKQKRNSNDDDEKKKIKQRQQQFDDLLRSADLQNPEISLDYRYQPYQNLKDDQRHSLFSLTKTVNVYSFLFLVAIGLFYFYHFSSHFLIDLSGADDNSTGDKVIITEEHRYILLNCCLGMIATVFYWRTSSINHDSVAAVVVESQSTTCCSPSCCSSVSLSAAVVVKKEQEEGNNRWTIASEMELIEKIELLFQSSRLLSLLTMTRISFPFLLSNTMIESLLLLLFTSKRTNKYSMPLLKILFLIFYTNAIHHYSASNDYHNRCLLVVYHGLLLFPAMIWSWIRYYDASMNQTHPVSGRDMNVPILSIVIGGQMVNLVLIGTLVYCLYQQISYDQIMVLFSSETGHHFNYNLLGFAMILCQILLKRYSMLSQGLQYTLIKTNYWKHYLSHYFID